MSHCASSNTNNNSAITVTIKSSSSLSTICFLLWTWNVSPVSIRIRYFFCNLQIQKHQHAWRLLHYRTHTVSRIKQSPISSATRGDQKVLQLGYKTLTYYITHAVIFWHILMQHQCIFSTFVLRCLCLENRIFLFWLSDRAFTVIFSDS